MTNEPFRDTVQDFVWVFTLIVLVLGLYFGLPKLVEASRSPDPTHFVFELVLLFILLIMGVVYVTERVGRGYIVERLFAYFTPNDQTPENMSEHFPGFAFSFLVLLMMILLSWDAYIMAELPDQIYGLVFDGFGGYLLAKDVLSSAPSASLDSKTNQLWGLSFLIFGFSLQILAIVIRSLPIP